MKRNGYDVDVDGEIQHIDVVAAQKAAGLHPERLVQARPGRSTAKIWLDCFLAFLILALPATAMISGPMFLLNLAAVLSIVICGYFRVVCLIVAAMSPPNTPHIVAIIQAPERLYCPRCGEPKTQKYCSGCGVTRKRRIAS